MPKTRRIAMAVAAALTLLTVAAVLVFSSRQPDVRTDVGPNRPQGLSSDLREAVDVGGIMGHAERFQAIADEHGGNRAAGTPGYDVSAAYVADRLRGAGYEVEIQSFEVPDYAVVRDADLEIEGATVQETDFALMQRSGTGEAEGRLRPVDARSSTSGCEPQDFEGFSEGDVALLRRGTCTFRAKAAYAEDAGASAVLIFNVGEAGGEVLRGSLGGAGVGIPVMGTSGSLGEKLLASGETPDARVFAAEGGGNRTTNVIAQMPGGEAGGTGEKTVMVGAHLDSVPAGPGINDNGSGSATVLEIALALAELEAKPRNRVRFAFWGAEEIGLLGSRHYVEGLGEGEIKEISAYLNFDMVGSPNFTNTVYEGPDEVEDVFGSYFEARDIEAETNSALDGRSDHGPFQDEGVPTGGLFSGAEGTKTEEQQEAFGGEAGAPFDRCYHLACDDTDNLSEESLDTLSDAAAHATAVLAGRGGG
ncbi:MAG: M20/M25/M40 family metallo-hydrolase [Actinomycetota bacterium]|nr:M20/M25/M40 family metallo-hydrolase [Actinomycetota bacterium]